MADRKQKYSNPSCRAATPAARHASVRMRSHRSSPGFRCESTSASPSSPRNWSSTPARRVSPGIAAMGASSTDDNGLTLLRLCHDRLRALATPTGAHVLVLDALLQEHDPLEQRFRPWRAPGHVDVDRDD